MADRLSISKQILEWAITRAGHSVNSFKSANPRIASWLDGTSLPTIKQLESFSKQVSVPFGYLFLQTPPVEKSPIPFFRGEANGGNLDINTYDTVLALQKRQDWLADYLSDNDFESHAYVGSINNRMPISNIISQIRSLINLPPTWAFVFKTNDHAVNHVTELLEEIGVTVVFNGVVGNNTHRPIDVEECRGFSLVNSMAPFIFVNSADSKTAQLFTLIHEFAHILLGFSAGFGGEDGAQQNEIERFCDRIAAEFLVPEIEFRSNWTSIEKTAKLFKVSQLVIARRAKDLGIISYHDFQVFYARYRTMPMPITRKSGGDYFLMAKKRVGYTFAVHVNNALRSNQITPIEAYRLTGLYGQTYTSFMSRL